jgi:hypothetical protein
MVESPRNKKKRLNIGRFWPMRLAGGSREADGDRPRRQCTGRLHRVLRLFRSVLGGWSRGERERERLKALIEGKLEFYLNCVGVLQIKLFKYKYK